MNELTVDGQFLIFIVGFAEDAHARHSSNKFGFCTRSIASFIFFYLSEAPNFCFPPRFLLFSKNFKKSCRKIWSVNKNAVPLHSLSGSNRGEILGCVFMLASRNARLDLWQTANRRKTSSARTQVHWVCAQATSHSYRRQKRTIEQESLAGRTELW